MQSGANVISLSGGKDSTAMLLMMVERGEPIADIMFFDTGWEFPQMYEHLETLEQFMGRKITRLGARLPLGVQTDKTPFDWMLSEQPVTKRGTDQIHSLGYGWPTMLRRWCTRLKQQALHAHLLALTHRREVTLPLRHCIGFAADEGSRVNGVTKKDGSYHVQRYPLIEWDITGSEALAYCKKRGFHWHGLYDHFSRVSCFCCPLQSLHELSILRSHYPDLWQWMLEMESWLPEGKSRRFGHSTVSALEERFNEACMGTAV